MHSVFQRCALAALLLAVTWADHHHPNPEAELSCHMLSAHNADFASALYRSLKAKAADGTNIFYSPLGISTALSMLSTGAHGETHSQLFSTLGYSTLNQVDVNEAYKCLLHRLGHSQNTQQLDVGSAVAVRSGFSPVEKFLKDIEHYYAGEVFNVDLTRPAEAAAEINTFIANKTHNKITNMVRDLSRDVVMVLFNYVYFKGEWEKPFNHELTGKADFYVDETTTVQVDMMMRTGDYKIYADHHKHATIVMLPYKGNTSMMIVLPNKGEMTQVEGHINESNIKRWRSSVHETYVQLCLPKFSISVDASLEDTLKAMGITNAFENYADFSGMSQMVKLKLSKVSQKAVLSVTEIGTEAAASTVLEIMLFSLPQTIRINRPFLVFILENSTDSILFMGKINNPTAM